MAAWNDRKTVNWAGDLRQISPWKASSPRNLTTSAIPTSSTTRCPNHPTTPRISKIRKFSHQRRKGTLIPAPNHMHHVKIASQIASKCPRRSPTTTLGLQVGAPAPHLASRTPTTLLHTSIKYSSSLHTIHIQYLLLLAILTCPSSLQNLTVCLYLCMHLCIPNRSFFPLSRYHGSRMASNSISTSSTSPSL